MNVAVYNLALAKLLGALARKMITSLLYRSTHSDALNLASKEHLNTNAIEHKLVGDVTSANNPSLSRSTRCLCLNT